MISATMGGGGWGEERKRARENERESASFSSITLASRLFQISVGENSRHSFAHLSLCRKVRAGFNGGGGGGARWLRGRTSSRAFLRAAGKVGLFFLSVFSGFCALKIKQVHRGYTRIGHRNEKGNECTQKEKIGCLNLRGCVRRLVCAMAMDVIVT